MAEYDAFGRKIGDNPLEQPAAEASPVAAPATPAAPPAPRSLRSRPFLIMIAAALVVSLAAIGIAVSMLAVTGDEEGGLVGTEVVAEEGPSLPAETPPSPGEPPPAPAPGEAPAPAEPASMITRPLFERAVRAMRAAEYGSPATLRVAAGRIDATLVNAKGEMSVVQVGPDAQPRVITTTGAGGMPSMPWSAVDPGAPQRLVRAAAEREKRSAADVDYLVLMPLTKPTWGLFFKGGTHYQGDAAGKLTRRVTPD